MAYEELKGKEIIGYVTPHCVSDVMAAASCCRRMS